MENTGVMHRIIVAGIGPGNPDYMIPVARRAIKEAKALVGGRRALEQYADNDPASGQHTIAITRDLEAVMDFIRAERKEHDVVVMVSGDPGYYSLLDALKREFPSECLMVIPGISAMQLAFARLSLPWHDARLLSFHGRQPAREAISYQAGTIIGMLTDTKFTSRTIPPLLMECGWPGDARLHICTRLSYANESVETIRLKDAGEYPEAKSGILIVEG